MKSKATFGFSILGLIATLSITAVAHAELGPVVRVRDKCPSSQLKPDEICVMTQEQADLYCHKQGLHLPTVKELAQEMNPAGVSATPQAGFEPIYDRDGRIDFYYNPAMYSAARIAGTPAAGGLSEQELEHHFYWSSSAHPDDSSYAYYVHGDDGGIDGGNRRLFDGAVRCVR